MDLVYLRERIGNMEEMNFQAQQALEKLGPDRLDEVTEHASQQSTLSNRGAQHPTTPPWLPGSSMTARSTADQSAAVAVR